MRKLFTILYWVITIGAGASVAASATWGSFAARRPRSTEMVAPGVTPDTPEGRQCAHDLKALYDDLLARAGQTLVGSGGPSPDAVGDWAAWSRDWHERLEARRTVCRLRQSPEMAPVARLAGNLERLHLAYTTALNGFSDVGRRHLVETRQAFESLGLTPPP